MNKQAVEMAIKESKITKRKLTSSYLTSMLSIALVLLCLGFVGMLLLNAQKLSDYVKENIGFTIFLKDDVKEADIRMIQKKLDAKVYVKSTKFVTSEEAANELHRELGEDFIEILGYNPLKPSIDIHLHAEYANPDSISFIESDFASFPEVHEVYYEKSLIHVVNDNVRILSVIILIPSFFLSLIAVALINNTIRLSVYSKRFIIRGMQLVGATHRFIRKPFLLKSSLHGIFAGILAIGFLSGIIYIAQSELFGVVGFQDVGLISILFAAVLLFGAGISWISTYFAVNKYLNITADELFY